jgi:hypothetical protein
MADYGYIVTATNSRTICGRRPGTEGVENSFRKAAHSRSDQYLGQRK